MKAIVMAGGEGTRLRPITEKLPKPCAEVGGVPVLKRILEMLEKNGVTQAVLTLRLQNRISLTLQMICSRVL